MDLGRDLTGTVVPEEVLRQQVRQLKSPLVLLPAADLSEELWMNFLEGLWLPAELLLEPLYGRRLVDYENLELQNLLYGHAPLVVLSYLIRQEIHVIALREALR